MYFLPKKKMIKQNWVHVLKSKGTVIQRDRDVVILKVLNNTGAKSFFKLGGGVCTDKNYALRGIILGLSTKFIKILLLDAGLEIKNKTLLYSSDKVLGVNKNIPGLIYSGIGDILGSFRPKK